MRIAVTGATGNVGSALVRRLLAAGHEVTGIARRPPADDGSVRWVQADLSRDCHAQLADAFAGADAVVHLVWGFQPTHRIDYLEEVGVGGTRRVLRAANEAGVQHLVHQSSIGAYSPRADDRPVDEQWPTEGIASSPYSRHKAAAERILDDFERSSDVLLTRMRPAIIGQHAAGSAQLRYFLPTLVPAGVLRHVPVLPIDRSLRLQLVHADDVADALARAVEGSVGGPFNLAADQVLTPEVIAGLLGARLVHVPVPVLRGLVDLSWRVHAQPVDRGWVDLAYAVPTMDTTRAETELGWTPSRVATEVLAEMLDGLAGGGHGGSEVLRPRTLTDGLRRALSQGTVTGRRRP